MRSVYKYEVPLEHRFKLELPFGAEVIAAGEQGELNAVLWAVVDPTIGKVTREFGWFGTGHTIDDPAWQHLFTLQSTSGLVLHLGEYKVGGRRGVL